jgi:hypothetical protein
MSGKWSTVVSSGQSSQASGKVHDGGVWVGSRLIFGANNAILHELNLAA